MKVFGYTATDHLYIVAGLVRAETEVEAVKIAAEHFERSTPLGRSPDVALKASYGISFVPVVDGLLHPARNPEILFEGRSF